jgi:hypothetical protein
MKKILRLKIARSILAEGRHLVRIVWNDTGKEQTDKSTLDSFSKGKSQMILLVSKLVRR